MVAKIEMEHRWFVKIHRPPDEMKAKGAGVKFFGPPGIGSYGRYMVNSADCAQDWLRFRQRWLWML